MNQLEQITIAVIRKVAPISEAKALMINNFIWLFADKILRMGVGLIVNIQITRFLGPAGAGLFDSSIALAGMFYPLVTLGMDSIVLRDLIKEPERKAEILGTALRLRVIAATCAIFLAMGLAFGLNPNDTDYITMVGIQMLTLLCLGFDVPELYYQSLTKSKYTVYARNIGFLVAVLWKIYLLYTKANVYWFVTALTLETLIGVMLAYRFLWKQGINPLQWVFNSKLAKEMVKAGFPLLLNGFAVLVFMKIDIAMIKQMLGNKEAGIYAAAVRLSEIWYFIPFAMIASVVPTLVKVHGTNMASYYLKYQRLFDLLFWFSIIMGGILASMSDFIVLLLYKAPFAESADILKLHIWSGVFVAINTASSYHFTYAKAQKIVLAKTVIAAALNVILNIYLIPIYGGWGSALATLISYAVAGHFSSAFFKESRFMFFMFYKSMNPVAAFRRIRMNG